MASFLACELGNLKEIHFPYLANSPHFCRMPFGVPALPVLCVVQRPDENGCGGAGPLNPPGVVAQPLDLSRLTGKA